MRSLRLSMPLICSLVLLSACQTQESLEQPPPTQKLEIERPALITSPREVLEAYLRARLHGEWSEAFKLTDTTEDERDYRLEAERGAPLAAIVGKASGFEIGELTISGNRAAASVSISMPDLTPFIQKLLMMGIKADMLGKRKSYDPILEELKDALQKKEYRMVTQLQEFELVKSAGSWKVSVPASAFNR